MRKKPENLVPYTRCPLCNNEDKLINLFVAKEVEYVNCECGMAFQPMYMTPEQIRKFYKSEYRLTVGARDANVTTRELSRERMRSKRQIDSIDGLTPKKHLDIGSSTGTFLKMVQEKYGCESMGVEPGDAFRKYSIEKGINTVADISEVDGKFDFISISHVLEHLVDPLEMLETIRGLLEDDGFLFVEVPRMGPGFSHPILFFEITIEKMLNKAGFDIIDMPKQSPIMVLAEKNERI